MTATVSERLALRPLSEADAAFVLRLVTDPDWLRHIGDRGVHSLADARAFVRDGPAAMLRDWGVGLHLVEAGGVPAGFCGLLRREGRPDLDLGFAFLPEFRGQGLATEAATAVLDHARETLGLRRVAAFVSPGNAASVRVLDRLGFAFEHPTVLHGDAVDQYGIAL